MCPYLVWLTLPILPLEFTVFLQTLTEEKSWHLLARMWNGDIGHENKQINKSEWHTGCLKHFIYIGEYKKYFCDQINIIHTASNHKTNTVTTSSHNKASNFIFCFWQHSHKSDNIFLGNSYIYWKKKRKKKNNVMVWQWNKGVIQFQTGIWHHDFNTFSTSNTKLPHAHGMQSNV